ncbi:MAG: hypothetical protein KDD92_06680 [Caldilineaceae bacterium]|nr:hypothetical protein [Caldilineaceae bacterium]
MTIRQLTIRPAFILLAALILTAVPAARPGPAMAQSASSYDDEIVFIDGDGYVRVLDLHQDEGDSPINFVSPDRDWESVALGDFNADGDMEIVAVGGGDADDNAVDGKLVIWDPVPLDGGGPVELYRRSIDGRAFLVEAGDFDVNVEGDEIVFGYLLQDEAQAPGKDEHMRLSIIKGTTPIPDGRSWTFHVERKDDGNEWNYITVGNIDNTGPDEIALLDEEGGEVTLYRIDGGWQSIWSDSSSNDPYRAVAFGDFYQGGYTEMAVTRNTDVPGNLFVYQYDAENDDLLEPNFWRFSPYPRFVWPADYNGDNEDELFFLRRDQDPRLVGLNLSQASPFLAANLNDDAFRVGVGGDFDADGREEIAIASDERILVYTEIETGNRTPIEYGFTTDRRNLIAGDLDSQGARGVPTFGLTRIGGNSELVTQFDVALAAGEQQQNAVGYYILNTGRDATITMQVSAPSQPDWLDYSIDINVSGENDAGTILAALYLSVDARDMLPGEYSANIIIRDTNPLSEVSNNPATIPIRLTVEPAALVPLPAAASFIYAPCTDGLAVDEQVIRLGGLEGLNYNAAVVDAPSVDAALAQLDGEVVDARQDKNGDLVLMDAAGNESRLHVQAKDWLLGFDEADLTPGQMMGMEEVLVDWPSTAPWVTASSVDGVIPDLLTLNIDPAEADGNLDQAMLVLVADRRGGSPPDNVHLVPIQYLCAAGQSHLPIILR